MYLPVSIGLFAKKMNPGRKCLTAILFSFLFFIFRQSVHPSYTPDWVEAIHDRQQLRHRESGGGTSPPEDLPAVACNCICEYKPE